MNRDALLAAYDAHLREDAEMAGARTVQRHGPVLWGEFSHGGFVSYRTLGGLTGPALDELVVATVRHFRDETEVARFEWKTRGHDAPDDLGERLVAHGLEAEEVETVMVGSAADLAVPVETAPGVVVRRVGDGGDLRGDVERMLALQEEVFGLGRGPSVDSVLADLSGDDVDCWIAEEASGDVIASGRVQLVRGTPFAGLWGGCTHPRARGRGVYRALVSARATSAIAMGAELVHSDCTAMSRPILERSGLVAVTTTTPYVWTR